MFYFVLYLVLCIWPTLCSGEMYTITSHDDFGTITLTASKTYEIWDDGPNRTTYHIEIYSPLIQYASQEIRVGLQWKWLPLDKYQSERVVFYAPVSAGRFNQYRVDRNYQFDGSLLFQNYQVTSYPKTYPFLTPELTSQENKLYQIVDSNATS